MLADSSCKKDLLLCATEQPSATVYYGAIQKSQTVIAWEKKIHLYGCFLLYCVIDAFGSAYLLYFEHRNMSKNAFVYNTNGSVTRAPDPETDCMVLTWWSLYTYLICCYALISRILHPWWASLALSFIRRKGLERTEDVICGTDWILLIWFGMLADIIKQIRLALT